MVSTLQKNRVLGFKMLKFFVKWFIFVCLFLISFTIIIGITYSISPRFSFWVDRHTLLSDICLPLPLYQKLDKLDDDYRGFSVYVFKGIDGWENGHHPKWIRCQRVSTKDIRFSIPYQRYIGDSVAELFMLSKNDNVAAVYVKKNNHIYLIIMSMGAGPVYSVENKSFSLPRCIDG